MKRNLKNRPSINDERFLNWCMDSFEDQKDKYRTFIDEEEKWFKDFEREVRKWKEVIEMNDSKDIRVVVLKAILGEDHEW